MFKVLQRLIPIFTLSILSSCFSNPELQKISTEDGHSQGTVPSNDSSENTENLNNPKTEKNNEVVDRTPDLSVTSSPVSETMAGARALPDCDASSSNTLIINSVDDLERLNDANLDVFCLTPGDYRSAGVIRLTRSGSKDRPRVLRSLPNNDHPYHRTRKFRSILSEVRIEGADYWIIDGLNFLDGDDIMLYIGNSKGTVVQRSDFQGGGGGSGQVDIEVDAQETLFQLNTLHNTIKRSNRDSHCIHIEKAYDTKILNNEIFDCAGDSIQIDPSGAEYTLISGNDMYITDAMRTDCSGRLDPEGYCACAEDALDIKATAISDESVPTRDEPFLSIVQNRMWGFRKADPACATTGGGGSAGVFHGTPRTRHILYANNLVFNTRDGIAVIHGSNRVSIIGNLFVNIEGPDSMFKHSANNRGAAKQNEFYLNTVLGREATAVGLRLRQDGPIDMRCNLFQVKRLMKTETDIDRTSFDFNAFSSRASDIDDYQFGDNLSFPDIEQYDATEVKFTLKQLTGGEELRIDGVRPRKTSPLTNACEPELGSRKYFGIDDRTSNWPGFEGPRTSTLSIGAFDPL